MSTVVPPAVRLGELHRGLDGALLVRARREPQERGVDGQTVGGDVDARPRRRDALDADEDPRADHDFMRASSGSKSGWLPTRETTTGYSSFMYMTRSSVPSTACSGGRYAISR